jgi:hypothetical protein
MSVSSLPYLSALGHALHDFHLSPPSNPRNLINRTATFPLIMIRRIQSNGISSLFMGNRVPVVYARRLGQGVFGARKMEQLPPPVHGTDVAGCRGIEEG